MANISITNATILNSETADVTKLTTNDNDLVNGLTDGTKDININNGTCGGTLNVTGVATFNGGINNGAGTMKTYIYQASPISSGDISAGYKDVTTASLTNINIRGLIGVIRDASDSTTYYNPINWITSMHQTSSTNLRVNLGTSIGVNDIISVVILYAE